MISWSYDSDVSGGCLATNDAIAAGSVIFSEDGAMWNFAPGASVGKRLAVLGVSSWPYDMEANVMQMAAIIVVRKAIIVAYGICSVIS